MIEAQPRTGRTHQIRAHLAYVGHPVLGDPEQPQVAQGRLDALEVPAPPRLMLHARRLALAHPRTGQMLRWTAPVPADFRDYWRKLRERYGLDTI